MRLLFPHATRLQENASRGLAPDPAAEAEQRLLGLPPRLAADWPKLFLEAFGRALRRYRSFRVFLESCTGCGLCAEACHFFRGTGDPRNIPGDRLALARDVFRRYFSPAGKRLHAAKLSERLLLEWFVYFNQCSQCRRCALFCPQGIDVSLVTQACREILASVGLCPAPAAEAAAQCLRSGNSLGVAPDEWLARAAGLEKWLRQTTGRDIKCPVDEYGADVLFMAPAEDLVRHPEAFAGYAKVFHAAGVSWTTSTYASDAANPGLFVDFRNARLILMRALEAARELRPRLVMWGESGAGWWAAGRLAGGLGCNWEAETHLEGSRPLSILEWAEKLLDRGAFVGRLRREANDRRNVLCHYPCHAARSTGLAGAELGILNSCCNFVSELPPKGGPGAGFCCGGGGGLSGERLRELRMAGFKPLAELLEPACRERGADTLATACATCRSVFLEGLSRFELPMRRAGIMQLLGDALYPPAAGGESTEGAE